MRLPALWMTALTGLLLMVELTDKQAADYARLKGFYPYRLFFLVQMPGETEATIWALRDRRAVNDAMRKGATVFQIS
jgi:hypothetical protein